MIICSYRDINTVPFMYGVSSGACAGQAVYWLTRGATQVEMGCPTNATHFSLVCDTENTCLVFCLLLRAGYSFVVQMYATGAYFMPESACVFFFKCFGVCSWFFVPWRTNRTSIVVKAVVDPVAVDCHSVCISCKRKVFLWFSLPWMCWMAFSTLGALWEEEEEA